MKIESKEKLAKLLATEDLDVQHQQVETAYFDVKSRTLVLPTWKDMPDNLYDLLVGHEVGHALFTPTSQDRLVKAYKKTSKACINILEDARIEKLVKKKYPGLRKPFFSGYQHLIEKDFFGLSQKPLDSMNILDKINLYFKIPTAVDIHFNEIEQSFIDRIEELKSFKDVENIAEEIYAYAKENQEEQEEDQGDEPDYSQSMPSDEMVDGMEQDSFEQESDQGESDEGEDEEDGKNEKPALTEEEEAFQKYMNGPDETDSSDEESKEESSDKDEVDGEDSDVLDHSKPESKPPKGEVKSETYDYFHERMKGLVDKNIKSIYLTIPDKVDLNTAVVDYKDVHKNIDDFYNKGAGKGAWQHYDANRYDNMREDVYRRANVTLSKFKKESVKTVNHIASEFERKKAADVYKKVLVTKTGVLDTNKIFSAKYNDDVFKKSIRMPEGKNHGLVMILDWSGSMQNNIFGCIKQVMELTFFCKKVNIPFEVYSFMEQQSEYDVNGQIIPESKQSAFIYKNGDLVVDMRVRLRNYLSSRMNARDYNNGLLNMCILANRYKRSSYGYNYGHYPAPKEDELGCTPLNGAILLTEHVIRNFKRENNLDNVNAVFLTDGEASGGITRYDVTKDHKCQSVRFWEDGSTKISAYIKDTKTKKNYLVCKEGHYTRGGMLTPVLLDIVKDRLGINIVGFFILDRFTANDLWRFVPRRNHVTYQAGQDHYKKFVTKARKDGWFVKTESGYDEYYVIRGDSLKEEDLNNDLNVKPGMTAHRMATNFMKKNNAFKANRVILSRFVDLITENTTV